MGIERTGRAPPGIAGPPGGPVGPRLDGRRVIELALATLRQVQQVALARLGGQRVAMPDVMARWHAVRRTANAGLQYRSLRRT